MQKTGKLTTKKAFPVRYVSAQQSRTNWDLGINKMEILFILGLVLTTSGTLLLKSSKIYKNKIDFSLMDLGLVFYGAIMIAITVALHGREPYRSKASVKLKGMANLKSAQQYRTK
jgi:ACR3 family arsenite efflux pump ArsB